MCSTDDAHCCKYALKHLALCKGRWPAGRHQWPSGVHHSRRVQNWMGRNGEGLNGLGQSGLGPRRGETSSTPCPAPVPGPDPPSQIRADLHQQCHCNSSELTWYPCWGSPQGKRTNIPLSRGELQGDPLLQRSPCQCCCTAVH